MRAHSPDTGVRPECVSLGRCQLLYTDQLRLHTSALQRVGHVAGLFGLGRQLIPSHESSVSLLQAAAPITTRSYCYACTLSCIQGIMGVDPSVPSGITAFPPGYIDQEKEAIVGLQVRSIFDAAVTCAVAHP